MVLILDRLRTNATFKGQNARDIFNFDLEGEAKNDHLVNPKTGDSPSLHYSTSHSIANSNTFYADSSDSHLVKQFAHAGHVDHANQNIVMTKTGTRTRTEDDGVKNNANSL